MRLNRLCLCAMLVSCSLLLTRCASNPPSADGPAPAEKAQAEVTSADPSPGVSDAAELSSKATQKYDDWCTLQKYNVGFPEASHLVLQRSWRNSFDEAGRIVRVSEDTNGDGSENKITSTTYEPDGVHYTRETLISGDPEATKVTQGKHEKGDPRLNALGRVHRVNADEYRTDDAGEPIGFQRKALRFLDRHGERMPKTEVEEVGVFILNEAGFVEAVFVAQGTDQDSSVPDIDALRARIRLEPDARRWAWDEDAQWNITSIFLFAYQDGTDQVRTQATWENPTNGSAPSLQAIADTINFDSKHRFSKIGPDEALIAELPESYRTHLSSLIIRAFNASNKKTRERQYDGKMPFLSVDLQLEYDAEDRLIRILTDSSSPSPGFPYADGIVDHIIEQIYDGDKLIERKEFAVNFDSDVTSAQIPLKWRSVTVVDEEENNPRDPKIALITVRRSDQDTHGNPLREETRTLHAVRQMHYDDKGHLIEIDSDGPDSNLSDSNGRRPGFTHTRIRHQYDAAGQKTKTQRDDYRFPELFSTTWTEYTYDAQGRLAFEALERQGNRRPGADEESISPEPWLSREHAFDAQGRREKTVVSGLKYKDMDAVVTYTYDDEDRLIAETTTPRDAEASTHRYIYEGAHLVAEEVEMSTQDQPHYRVDYHYDADGRKIRAVHRGVTNVTPVTIPPQSMRVTEYTYEDGLVRQEVDHVTTLERYNYDCHEDTPGGE